MTIDFIKLAEPFHPDDIEWRIGSSGTSSGKVWARCFAYVTNRSVMQRLDDVCGPENWKVEFKEYNGGKDHHGALCGISIRVGDEWVTKWDGANSTDVEAVKGGLSDAMKRAAVQWGIGRYLYKLEEGFALISMQRQQGYNYGKTKEGTVYYWLPPQLPAWALPGEAGGEVPAAKAGDSHDEHGTHDEMDEAPEPAQAPPAKPAQAPAGSDEEKKLLKVEMDKVALQYNLDTSKVTPGVSIESWEDFSDAGIGAWINKLPRRDLQHSAIRYFLFVHYSMRVVAAGPYPSALNIILDEMQSDNRLNDEQKKVMATKIEKAKDIPF